MSIEKREFTCEELSNLAGADLRRANLRRADLAGANLYGANLYRAKGGILQINGIYSYQITMTPTPQGWHTTIGCWNGTIQELQTLIDSNNWPESEGEQIIRNRPLLQSFIQMAEAHMEANKEIIHDLKNRWSTKEQ